MQLESVNQIGFGRDPTGKRIAASDIKIARDE